MTNRDEKFSLFPVKCWKVVVTCFILGFISVLSPISTSHGQDVRSLPIIPQVSLTEKEIRWIEENPVVTATNNINFVPFDFSRNGLPMGFAIDYLNLVAEKVGLSVDYIPDENWRNLVGLVENGEIDIMHSIIVNAERTGELEHSSSYLRLPVASFGRMGAKPIRTRDDLQGKRLGVLRGWAATDTVRNEFPELEIVELENMDAVIDGLSAGDIDLLQSTPYSIRYRMDQNFIQNVETIDNEFTFNGENYREHRFAVNKNNPVLMAILEKGMAGVSKKEFDEIARRWLDGYSDQPIVNLTEEERDWLSTHQSIKIVAEPDLAPLVFRGDNGEVRGIAVDFFNNAEEKLGVKFEWILKDTFADVIDDLENSRADIIPAINATEERKQQFLLIDPVIEGSQMIFARSGSPIYGSMEALSEQKLVQVKGYSVTAALDEKYPELNITEVDNLPEALSYITSGRADAFISDILVTSYYISQQGFGNIVVVGETEFSGDVSVAIRKDAPILASIIDKAMKTITEAEKAEIQGKWLSLNITNTVDYSKIWQVVVISGVVLFVILFWNNVLRREIKTRKKIEEKLVLAQKEARAESEAKSIFLANMSHEIRTPLNAIVGFSEAMKMGIHGEIKEPKYQDYLDDICGSGKHLTTVINDILDLSKIEAGKMKITEGEFSLNECINSAIQMNAIQADSKNISVQYVESENYENVRVRGDCHAIKRALVNLISNAIKFTSENGKVSCRCHFDAEGCVSIDIEDNGIGIPAERINAVVKPFEQSNMTHELNEEGTGLGLPIVKNLVELHGGIFRLESIVSKGTKAIISLPANRVLIQA